MKIQLFFLSTFFSFNMYGLEVTHDMQKSAPRQAMALLIAVTANADNDLMQVARILAKNLERSGQFVVTVKGFAVPQKENDLTQLFDAQFPLEIFLNSSDEGKAIGWRLYDVPDKKLIKGKKYYKRGKLLHGYADNIADDLWPVLTSQPSSFSSKLAYVKKRDTLGKKKRDRSVVCIANSDGSQEQIIIPKLGTYVALYWHHDTHNPCLFCSEFTRFNVRLISSNLQRQMRTVLNLKGTCVGISVAHDNNKSVYCRSGTIWQYAYDPVQKQGVHKPLIHNEGKNVSPTLLDTGDIIFCSDSGTLRKGCSSLGPKIYRYAGRDGSITRITNEGYCVGPSYCKRTNKIAYSKKINGVMQLCIYDCSKNVDTQITFDAGNKIDSCWSPCGTSIVYCYQKDRASRIAIIHARMKKVVFVTPATEYCSCPSWSPVYDSVPVIS